MNKQKQIIGFIALSIAMFIGMLDSTIVNIALPDIMNYFKSNLNDTSWISTIYVLSLSVFMITASKLADQFGRKKIMMIGILLFGCSSALCGLSNSLLFLIIMRFIQGIGGAIITPVVVPMALELFGKEKTRTVAGSIGAITALAAAGGPPIGGLIIKYISWQAIFFVNVPLALISFLLIALFVGESYDKTVSKSIDIPGMLLLTATLFLLTFALLKGNTYGWGSALIISMFAGSAVSLVLLILTETKVKAPMVELGLFRESTFTASCVCYMITGFAIMCPCLIFNYFLQNALGYEALDAAFIIIGVSLTVIVSMPLGTMISGKFGARPVNFLGILVMAAGTLLLSRLRVGTSKPQMIFDMIVCGFGLGFSCQSMVSSIKYLPFEKSGMGSGIVNAARQIGTCIGIALLVSVLDTNVASAKINIQSNAIADINKLSISDTVKTTATKDVKAIFSNSDSTKQKDLQNKLQDDIKNSLINLSSSPRPKNNEVLEKLYDASSSLNVGAGKAADGQQTLSTGLGTLSTGLGKLQSGSQLLTSGLGTMDDGLSQALSGAQTLNSASSKGLSALSSGIGQLNNGAQKLLSQFSSSGDSNSPTIYDGVTSVASGAQVFSSKLNGYVSAVDNTYYLMIKSNPASSQLLAGYQSSLAQAGAIYASTTDETAKEQYKQQVQALGNLVTLYTAGTDVSVTSEQQFEAKLSEFASQSENNQNIVSSGSQITAGASKLASASQKVSTQFSDSGAFKSGMEQIANGAAKLEQSSGSMTSLQSGIDKLTSALFQLQSGSGKLIAGSQSLQYGVSSAKSGSDQLLSGSNELADANIKIKNGAAQIASGVGLAGQKTEIEDVISKISEDKNDKIAEAFDKDFLLAAIILIALSFCGLFTDRKREEKKS
jgi:EmrB/QacA subfamily drug resistance transporter